MAGESIVQVTEGSGKKLHTWQTTIGGNAVEDEFVVPGEFPYPSYVATLPNVSLATANDHLMALNAGASLKVKIRRIRVEQQSNATAVALDRFSVVRTTTTTPTGGTAVTPAPFDTADAASGAVARSLPTVKGTETTELASTVLIMRQALSATQTQPEEAWEWIQLPGQKPLIIPAGATNGIVVKHTTAVAGASVIVTIEFVEQAF